MKGPGKKSHGTKKVLGLVMVVGIIAAGTYAFTAANTFDPSNAGQAAETVSGYTFSGIQYTSSTTNPHKLESVTFDVSYASGLEPRVMKASFIDASDVPITAATGQTWYTCAEDVAVADRWTCSAGATDALRPEISAVNELDIVAHQ